MFIGVIFALTLFNMTGLDPSTVWPLCHMRHVCKDDFLYFGSSGPHLWYDPYVTWDMLAKTTFAISDRLQSKPCPPTPSQLSSVTESTNTAGKWTWVITNWWYPGQSKVWLCDMTYVTYKTCFLVRFAISRKWNLNNLVFMKVWIKIWP